MVSFGRLASFPVGLFLDAPLLGLPSFAFLVDAFPNEIPLVLAQVPPLAVEAPDIAPGVNGGWDLFGQGRNAELLAGEIAVAGGVAGSVVSLALLAFLIWGRG